jgi:hypothetical protein
MRGVFTFLDMVQCPKEVQDRAGEYYRYRYPNRTLCGAGAAGPAGGRGAGPPLGLAIPTNLPSDVRAIGQELPTDGPPPRGRGERRRGPPPRPPPACPSRAPQVRRERDLPGAPAQAPERGAPRAEEAPVCAPPLATLRAAQAGRRGHDPTARGEGGPAPVRAHGEGGGRPPGGLRTASLSLFVSPCSSLSLLVSALSVADRFCMACSIRRAARVAAQSRDWSPARGRSATCRSFAAARARSPPRSA